MYLLFSFMYCFIAIYVCLHGCTAAGWQVSRTALTEVRAQAPTLQEEHSNRSSTSAWGGRSLWGMLSFPSGCAWWKSFGPVRPLVLVSLVRSYLSEGSVSLFLVVNVGAPQNFPVFERGDPHPPDYGSTKKTSHFSGPRCLPMFCFNTCWKIAIETEGSMANLACVFPPLVHPFISNHWANNSSYLFKRPQSRGPIPFLKAEGLWTAVSKRCSDFGPESKFPHPNLASQCNLKISSCLPQSFWPIRITNHARFLENVFPRVCKQCGFHMVVQVWSTDP